MIRLLPPLLAAAALAGCFDDSQLSRGDGVPTVDAAVDGAKPAPDLAVPAVDGAPPADLSGVAEDLAVGPNPDLAAPPPDLALPSCNALLCDDFEPTLAAAWGSPTTMNATVAVDTQRAYRGTHSLHVTSQTVPANSSVIGEIGEGSTFGGMPVDFYMRAFFYMPSPAPPRVVRLMAYFENVSPYDGLGVFVDSGSLAIGNNVLNTYYKSTTALPTDRWVCLEWHVHAGGAGVGYFHLDLDGGQVAGLTKTEATTPAGGFGGFSTGESVRLTSSGPTPPFDLSLDSVILDDKPIGCAK